MAFRSGRACRRIHLSARAAETEFLGDCLGRLAGIIQQPVLFEPDLPEAMQTRPGILVFNGGRALRVKRAFQAAELFLDHLAQVLDEMEAIGDLTSL